MKSPSGEDKRLDQMDEETLSGISRKAARKMHYRRRRSNTLWFGLGTMGVVGWSIAVPTVIGIAIGLYLDENVAAPFSWVLTGLVLGVTVGCLNAWFWISQQRQEIQERRKDQEEQ